MAIETMGQRCCFIRASGTQAPQPKPPSTASTRPGDESASPAAGRAPGHRVCLSVVLQGAYRPSGSLRPSAPAALSCSLPSQAPSAPTTVWSPETPGSVLGGGHSRHGSKAPKCESAPSVSARRADIRAEGPGSWPVRADGAGSKGQKGIWGVSPGPAPLHPGGWLREPEAQACPPDVCHEPCACFKGFCSV